MTPRNRRQRRDANHYEFQRELPKMGANVIDTSQVPNFIDLVVGFRGHTVGLEIKTAEGRSTRAQIEFRETWKGGPVFEVRTVEDAVEKLTALSPVPGWWRNMTATTDGRSVTDRQLAGNVLDDGRVSIDHLAAEELEQRDTYIANLEAALVLLNEQTLAGEGKSAVGYLESGVYHGDPALSHPMLKEWTIQTVAALTERPRLAELSAWRRNL